MLVDQLIYIHSLRNPNVKTLLNLLLTSVVGIILNILNIVTLSMSIEQVTYKILLGMAVADLLVRINF